jgi:DNA repair protein RecO (recombination protein O)
MGQIETEAIVLRTYDLAEADKIVVCLTREAGVVRGVARGARRLKSRFGAGLEPFTFISLVYFEREGRELVSVRQLEIRKSNFKLAGNVDIVTAMAHMSDLVISFSPPHEPNDKMYRMVVASMDAIENSPDDFESALRYFEVWTLLLGGFFSIMKNCFQCGQKFDEQQNAYVDSELRQLCEKCGKGRARQISADTRGNLVSIQRLPPAKYMQGATQNTDATKRELTHLTRWFIEHVLEREGAASRMRS